MAPNQLKDNSTEKSKKIATMDDDDDRLSNLPEPIIHHILSFLPANEIPRLGFVSRKFQNLCSSTSYLDFNLNFDKTKCSPKCKLFQKYLNRFLDRSYNGKISKLRLHWFCCSSKWQGKGTIFSMWTQKALNSSFLQELDIGVPMTEGKRFILPNNITDCKSLKVLKLKLQGGTTNLRDFVFENLEVLSLNSVWENGFEFGDWIRFNCKSLKVLNLKKVSGIEKFILASSSLQVLTIVSCHPPDTWGNFIQYGKSDTQIRCPSLEQLTISKCCYRDLILIIIAPSLKKLMITKCYITGFFDVNFSAEKLQSLCIDTYCTFSCPNISLCQIASENCLESLRDVYIYFEHKNYDEFTDNGLTKLFNCIRYAKSIKLDIGLISDLYKKDQLPITLFENVEHLEVENGYFEYDEISHVAAFLVGLRNLKSLTLLSCTNRTKLSEIEIVELLCSEMDEIWRDCEKPEMCLRSYELKKVKAEFQWTWKKEVSVVSWQ